MRKSIVLFGMLMLVLVLKVQAQSFEGSFVMQIMDAGSFSRMSFYVKGGKILLEPIDETLPKPVRILIQKGNDNVYLLTEEQGAKLAILNTFMPPSKVASIDSSYNAMETGKKKMIGMYECRQVIVDNGEGQKLEMWVTSTMGFTLSQLFETIGRFSAAISDGDYLEVTKNNDKELYQKNMALEINEQKEGGVQILIKDIVKKVLPEEDFNLQGYTVIDMKAFQGK